MKPKENKSNIINFRVTEEKRTLLEKEAKAKGLTLSKCLDSIIEKHFEPKLVIKTSEVINDGIYDKSKEKAYLIIGSIAAFFGLIWLFLKAKNGKNRPPNYPELPL